MTNREAFATALAVLGNTFDRKLTGPAIEGYWIALSDLTEGEFARATKRALSESKFMPSPSELLAFAGHAPRDLAAEAPLAWDAVRRAMDNLDVYGNPDFGPVVNAVVRNLGGWIYLCEQKVSDLEWRRKDFERVYKLWADKDPGVIPDGAPLVGEWRHAPVTRIQIAGLPAHRPALAPVRTKHGEETRVLIRKLADSKSGVA